MNASLRVLMGIATLAILIPAVTLVVSNRPTITSEAASPINDSSDESAGLAASPITPQLDSNRKGTIGPIDDIRRSTTIAVPTTADGNAAKSTSSTSSGDATSTTTSEHHHDAPSSTVETETTEPSATTGTITGEACPCTVTGTATLEAEIRLQGDLMVDGGTLIARSGVNVDGNGFQIMFMNGGRADFQGTPTSTWSGNGSQTNLTRDVNFRDLRRIMFHEGAGPSTLKFFSVRDSGTPDVLGDYPIHFHLNGNSTRGTIVEGVVVVNGRNHAFVPHGSHGITFKDTIATNIRGDAYWWDAGQGVNDSNNVVYDHALADGVTPAATGKTRLSGFVLRGGSNNVIKNSAAVNISGGKDCAGFQWPEKAGSNAVWTFQNNYSSSSDCHGIFVWQNDSENHVINGFTGNTIDHGAYRNQYRYNNVTVDRIEIHALGWQIDNSTIGNVIAFGHNDVAAGATVRFERTTIQSFIIDNGSGKAPGRYILSNTNLNCSDIKYESVYPGTQVTINGKDC